MGYSKASSSESVFESMRSEGLRDEAPRFVPEAVEEAQKELDRVIASLSGEDADIIEPKSVKDDSDRSGDLYLIISSKRELTAKYGHLGFEQLDTDLHQLEQVVEQHVGLECAVAYVDDAASLTRYALQPVDPQNPWQIKRLVDKVDSHLNERGGAIRYLLIVGGDGIVPFHRLPNPVDDQDHDVPSDNPYACRDSDYLVPDRAVGRMPDGESEGLGFLHSLIRMSVKAHRRRTGAKGLLGALGGQMIGFRHALHTLAPTRAKSRGLGYSASIWRKASRAVFRVIGDDSQLRTCPPLTYEGFNVTERPHLSYFNLHGIEDGPNWYGQRDSLFPADYPLFPLALRPQDLNVDDHADSVVFTEACYGANILGKNARDSIALRFLEARALALVGSTKVSYGSIAPPLLGADLMARYFWEGLQGHLTAGEALRYAKVNLVREMERRQGYLDAEDQKALISFVLYGDPSLPIRAIQGTASVGSVSKGFCPPLICQRNLEPAGNLASEALMASVTGRVEASLPHMSDARIRSKPLPVCDGTCDGACARSTRGGEGAVRSARGHTDGRRRTPGWAITLEKSISVAGDGEHHQVVKVVVDESGHVLRLSVSK